MPVDPESQQQLREAAEERLRARYGSGQPLIPTRAMNAVRGASLGLGLPAGEPAPEVPAGDLLAALTQVGEAQHDLDVLEHDLIAGARERGATWQQIADHLGLTSRQAAENRALRLERAVQARGDRYVERQREDRARQRNGESWCRAHEQQLRAAAAALVDVAEAWPLLRDAAGAPRVRALAAAAEDETRGPELAQLLRGLRYALDSPSGQERLPDGERTGEALSARDQVLGLLDQLAAERARDPRLSTNR
ncbi:hypothetical protein P3T27_007526 [Kitasatospora sp. MAA19]|uniref:hypothetical protein n=1 Tax=unclassified Kitasatospora TaxID=2633591 RepID=UPI0024771ECF|nr:hypothetical protein [Kitasatospora sp. MAA19]MDH6710775.1 hypothetical protein [Kitasatospora sp. MAA19]